MQLILLSGGAAEGLVAGLRHEFQIATGCGIAGTYGAVGAMREQLLAGAPADIIVLTSPLIAELTRLGHVRPGSAVDIGLVHTGLAVRAGDPTPPLGDARA
ncbi:MAG TPA: substrate-binding domain-containing protein, partial [Hyphomicrobiaceae bacterium]|nr:substrate-binding domain-containing protein [Hyphomicrobiaceae bacterium]